MTIQVRPQIGTVEIHMDIADFVVLSNAMRAFLDTRPNVYPRELQLICQWRKVHEEIHGGKLE